jgi:antitoxin HicB|nr:MAG TPA: helix-turn-helix domain protein [Caudoviricetes sp.]
MSEKIKEARVAAGLTQKEMCALLNIPPRTLQDWEAGRRNPPSWVESLILEKLDCRDDKNQRHPTKLQN